MPPPNPQSLAPLIISNSIPIDHSPDIQRVTSNAPMAIQRHLKVVCLTAMTTNTANSDTITIDVRIAVIITTSAAFIYLSGLIFLR